MELRRYWEILLRRKWVFVVIFLTIASTTIIGTYCLTPSYEATAKIAIETSTILSTLLDDLGVDTQRTTSSPRGAEKYELMGYDVVNATVKPLLNKLISQLQLRDRDHDLIEPDALIKPSIKKLILPEPFIEVEQYEDTNILEIAAISVYPEEAMLMANTLANLYIEDQLKQIRKEYENTRRYIQSKIKKERSKYFDALKSIKEFRVKEKLVDLDTNVENFLDRLSDLRSQYEGSELSVARSEAAIKDMKTRLSGIRKFRLASKEIANNELLQSLKGRLYDYMVELASLKTEYQLDHPNVIQLKRQVERTKDLIKNEATKMFSLETREVDPLYDEVARDLTSEYVSLFTYEAERDGIKEIIDKHEEKLMDYPSKTMRQEQLQLFLTVSAEIYQSLYSYLNRVSIAESITLSEIRIIDPASKPDLLYPYFPKKMLTCFLGFFMGLFWGLIVAFLVEYLDDTIHTSEDLHEFKSLDLLGTVPSSMIIKKRLISELAPESPVVEAYRVIKNRIKYLNNEKTIKTLIITSPVKGNGRTTTAVNLGISISNEGKKVLIIDLDLKNPAIHRKLRIGNAKGITDHLLNNIPIEEILIKTEVENLTVILSGGIFNDPTRIIESPKLKDLIDQVSLQYDLVIIDGPHSIPFNDALALWKYVNGLIIVIESGKTTSRLLKECEHCMRYSNFKLEGLVINKF